MLPKFFDNREWSSIYLVFIYNGLVQSITGVGQYEGRTSSFMLSQTEEQRDAGQFLLRVWTYSDKQPETLLFDRKTFRETFRSGGAYTNVIWNSYTLNE